MGKVKRCIKCNCIVEKERKRSLFCGRCFMEVLREKL